jgi:hypothetical protein
VAEWLRSLTSNHLPLTAVGSNPDRNFVFLDVRIQAIKLAYGMSVVLLGCPFMPEIMHGKKT